MASIPRTQLSGLSNEILLLIIEELDDLNPASLFQLRLVSQRFDTLATPQFYHSVIIDPLLFPYPDRDELDITCRDRILTNIRTHTRRVSIRRSLNWKGVLDLILSMKHFTALSWSYWGEVYPTVEGMTIPAWFGAVHNRWPDFKLVVEGASNKMLHQATLLTKVLLERIPQAMLSTHLVSFGAKDLSRHLNSDDGKENLKKILAKSSKLREVRLDGKGAYRFHTYRHTSERLPPLERLHLCGYLWTLPMGNVPGDNANWDTSSLTHLELRESNTRFFFHSVPPSNFSHLRSLKMDTWPKFDGAASLDLMEDERQHATELRTAMNHINALEELCITCWLSALPLSAITRHGATLKSLMLYDHGWYESSPSISLEYLETIRSSCPHLTALGLNQRNCNFKRKALLNMLTNFRNLRNVTLRVESLVNKEYTADNEIIDVDLIAVHKDFSDLLFNKEGAPLEKMVFVVEVYSILLPQEEDEDGLPPLREDLRIFHCENGGNIGPVVHEETLPSVLDVNTRLWELDAI